MRKWITGCAFLFAAGVLLFAGDVARFVDIGFSADGKSYFFGQYGMTDKKYLPYAEIYAVDIQKNDFIKVFKSGAAQAQNGLDAFEELKAKNKNFLSVYNCTAAAAQQILYVRANDSRAAPDTLEFADFEHSTIDNRVHYAISLQPHVEGRGKTAQSSFYITIERKDQSGAVLQRVVAGNPDIKRKGVTGYRIEKIFAGADAKSLIFIVEKTVADDDGHSVRYMVEAVRF